MAVKSDRNNLICFAPVAQLDRASGYGPEGREFESSPARQTKKFTPCEWAFFVLCNQTEEIRTGRFVKDELQPFGERLQSPRACRRR